MAGVVLYVDWGLIRRDVSALVVTPSATTAPPAKLAATPVAASSPTPDVADIIGFVDEPRREAVVSDTLSTSGWALAQHGVRRVEIRVDGQPYQARYGTARLDVSHQFPSYPSGGASGFVFERNFADLPLARHALEYTATDNNGKLKSFGWKSLIPPRALTMWRSLLDASPALIRKRFYFLMLLSGVTLGGASEIDTQYKDYISRTQKIGIGVPILYLRTTRGATEDWRFDPTFDLTRKCGNGLVAEDNLSGVIDFAVKTQVPVQFVLNGGIWSDSSCEAPQWDLTDQLEEDPANCQWTQSDQVFPDNYLKGLPGSVDSPELARTLTYNVYATKVRAYKKRNLQAAARMIASFGRKYPELLVGVALDSDTYMNPFFFQREIFDYNPGMLRQFREWLRGAGPYAGKPKDGAPDLSRYRRAKPFSLEQVNTLARQRWKTWAEVQPPRQLPGSPRDALQPGETPFWDDPWWQAWDAFRKHVVDLHYDELSTWVHESGIPSDVIFSAQGFIKPDPGINPFAVHIFSRTQNYDSSGVSVEGAIPRYGHLGAVIYGEAARNDVQLEGPHSMFATFGRMDDGWAIVEYNNTDLKRPNEAPTYAAAYRTFRDAFNYGAREISAMAWNGSNGVNVGKPGYLHYTAWRNTLPEQAMLDFLVSHADVPWSARLWTFGTARHADDDGWVTARGSIVAGTGYVTLEPADGALTLLSPADQVIRPDAIERMLFRWEGKVRPTLVKVAAQIDRDGTWYDIGTATGTQITFAWPAQWRNSRTIVERLKLEFTFPADATSATLSRVLLYPRDNTH